MSRALKSRHGTFTVQWQRAHVAAADIKRGNHDMVLVFGNETADAMVKKAASEAALRGAAGEQGGLGGCADMAGPTADR